MSTPSYIGKVTKDGQSVEYIYCHWDGGVDGVGNELINTFNDENAIDILIQEGNHSSIAGERVSYHSMGRGARETDHYSSSLEAFLTKDCQDQEYTYLFLNGQWIFTPGRVKGWSVLSPVTFDV